MAKDNEVTALAAAAVLLCVATAAFAAAYRARWTNVPGAAEYRVYVRTTRTPWAQVTPQHLGAGTLVGSDREAPFLLNETPGETFEVAVDACSATQCSGLSNTRAVIVPSSTATATITPTPTRTPTATATHTPLNTPHLLDVSGNGHVTSWDAAKLLQRGDVELARRALRIGAGLGEG